ncbi:MAG: glycosyltransferase [Bacteroidales bacterium]|nr:glycosyltransferase [Bacteroidales bacterium]
MPLISIITVVYNSEKYIERTLQSIAAQSGTDYEYIVIDGGSTDATLSIIEKYKHIVSFLTSEPDKGLYDAMNKGLRAAKGKYVWYINSGDRIYDKDVIKNLEQCYALHQDADIFYGQTQLVDEQNRVLGMRKKTAPEKLDADSFKKGMVVCHQSILIKKDIVNEYNLKYKVDADYLWVLEALEKSHKNINTGMILSQYMENGFSVKNRRQANMERMKIMIKHYGFFAAMRAHVIIALKYIQSK